jgi:hypothetical protein
MAEKCVREREEGREQGRKGGRGGGRAGGRRCGDIFAGLSTISIWTTLSIALKRHSTQLLRYTSFVSVPLLYFGGEEVLTLRDLTLRHLPPGHGIAFRSGGNRSGKKKSVHQTFARATNAKQEEEEEEG